MSDDLARLDATAQAELVRRGEVSPSELVEAAIGRIEALNPQLNAVIHERFEAARREAAGQLPDGPLRGVPCVLKDLDGTSAGDPYHAGSVGMRDAGYVAPHDSHLVARLRAAGLVVLGRTNTPELGLIPTTEPLAYGPTRNPWDPERSPGGSSGGSAASVASLLVPIGHAGDGGGSIRIPASACGLVGLKPTRGRHSLGPDVGEGWGGLVVQGVVTRSVRDTAVVLDAIHGSMPGDPYTAPPPAHPYAEELGIDPGPVRVGVLSEAVSDPTIEVKPACRAALDAAASLLESLGHEVADEHPTVLNPEIGAELTARTLPAFSVWALSEVERLGTFLGRPVREEDVEPGTWAIAEMGRAVSALDYVSALEFFHRFTREMASWWAEGHDLLLTPTLPEVPPTLGQFAAEPDNPLAGVMRAASLVPFTIPFNITGQPAVSLPLHWSDEGLPVGVQLVAAAGREDLLIRVAAQVESAMPWADRVPPIHA